jgi:hypothetical protein
LKIKNSELGKINTQLKTQLDQASKALNNSESKKLDMEGASAQELENLGKRLQESLGTFDSGIQIWVPLILL